jgi:hypothetical protein
MALNLSRNTKVLASTVSSGWSGAAATANTFELNVLDGYSFSQATNATDITLNEAGTAPQRGHRSFNDSLAPVDWSFTTYVRPFQRNDGTDDVNSSGERILWAGLWGDALADADEGVHGTKDTMSVSTSTSNIAEAMKMQLYFVMDSTVYHLSDATVNSVEIDFSIDGIAQATWSGFANVITDFTATKGSWTAGTDYMAVPTSADFIRNKLSTVTLARTAKAGIAGHTAKTYTLALTGGSISIDNGITYLTPEELGVRNEPIGSFTGSRTISGTLNAYLKTGTAGANDTGDLFDDMAAFTETENYHALSMIMGGTGAKGTPSVTFDIPACQLQIPTVDVQDVIATTISFSAQGTNGAGDYEIGSDNEMTVAYYNSIT